MYLFIASTSFSTLLWRSLSRVCWTQQEVFHWFHWYLGQAQDSTSQLCLIDYFHEMSRKELSLLGFGWNSSPAPRQSVKHPVKCSQSAELSYHIDLSRAHTAYPAQRQPTLIRTKLFKGSVVIVLSFTFRLVSAPAPSFFFLQELLCWHLSLYQGTQNCLKIQFAAILVSSEMAKGLN